MTNTVASFNSLRTRKFSVTENIFINLIRMQKRIIVIGSGAGGLAAALCLARAGHQVSLLEQHYVPGGWCHSFYLNGQRFSPGVHYLGRVGKGMTTSTMFEGLGIANDLVFFRMNPKGYEHCLIDGQRFDLPAGPQQLFESLAARFPREKENLRKYLKLVDQVSKQLYLIPQMNGFWDNVTIPFRTAQLGKYGLFSLKRVINWHIKDPLLKQVLNVQCGDYGLPPALASFPLHCAAMDHYIEGGYYPMGGGAAIVKAFTRAIRKHGGEIRTGEAVKRIIVEKQGKDRRATGVILASGEIINADIVVSNADPGKTYLEMVGIGNLSKKMHSRLLKTRYSVTSLILFLTVDRDLRKAGMDSGNIWVMPEGDLDNLFETMSTDDILSGDHFPGFFVSCSTLKDPPSFNGRYHNLEVITFLDYKTFRSFAGEDIARSPEYLKYKDRLAQKLLNSLERVVPGVKDHVVQMDLGTPITNEFYVNGTAGNSYGTEKTLKQIGPFAYNMRSEIDNLYLCGASILAHGVSGSTNSGIATAAKILGCTPDDLIRPIEGQQTRVYEAEDPSDWPEWIRQKMQMKQRGFKEIDPSQDPALLFSGTRDFTQSRQE